jgi:adenylate cyclase
LWADKFEGELQEIFDLQDSVTTSVVGAIAPRLIAADAEIVKRKPPESWDSYDFYLRGLSFFNQRTPDAMEQALDLFRKAIDRNQEFGLAYARAASSLFNRPQVGGRALSDEERAETLQLLTRALVLASDDDIVLSAVAGIFTYWKCEAEHGSDLSDQALAINPNNSGNWAVRGWVSVALGDGAGALDAFNRAIRLNPADNALVESAMHGSVSALNLLHRDTDALEMNERVLARRPNDLRAWFSKYAIDADPAHKADTASRIRALFPHLRSSTLKQMFNLPALRNAERRALLEHAIASLGLPE